MKLIKLKARKEKLSARDVGRYAAGTRTVISDMEGNIKAVFGVEQRQPRRGSKTITLNCFRYALIWD